MKIVKQGVKPNRFPWMGRYSCVHCKSEFELGEEDEAAVLDTNDDQRDGYSVRVVCPVCEQERWLSEGPVR
jgi:DNA-directed RNA polymerase subunit RPC12/RpoP